MRPEFTSIQPPLSNVCEYVYALLSSRRRLAETQPKLHFLIIEHESNILGEFGCPDMLAREMRPEFTSIQPPLSNVCEYVYALLSSRRRLAETQPKLHFLIIEHESNILGEFGCPDMLAREMRPEFTSIQPLYEMCVESQNFP